MERKYSNTESEIILNEYQDIFAVYGFRKHSFLYDFSSLFHVRPVITRTDESLQERLGECLPEEKAAEAAEKILVLTGEAKCIYDIADWQKTVRRLEGRNGTAPFFNVFDVFFVVFDKEVLCIISGSND